MITQNTINILLILAGLLIVVGLHTLDVRTKELDHLEVICPQTGYICQKETPPAVPPHPHIAEKEAEEYPYP